MRKLAAALLVVALASCSSGRPQATPTDTTTAPATPTGTESAAAVESNPPGDIPDNQVFIVYRAAGGFELKVPEGWTRRAAGSSVSFSDKLNVVAVSWAPASSAPTVASARRDDLPKLQRTEHAFELKNVTQVTLPAGQAVLIEYRANSTPNDVTGKQYRLEVLRYELWRNGTEAVLTLSSPVGADNVDPWRIVTESFKWV
jgi:hypothetical protein